MSKYHIDVQEMDRLERTFTYHAPKADQIPRYTSIRDMAKSFYTHVLESCPPSRERSLALTDIETAVMRANAAISRNE